MGRGLVHAYEMENRQMWSGCIVDNGIFTYLRSFQKIVMDRGEALRVEKFDSLVVESEVPLKDKIVKRYVRIKKIYN